MSYFVVRYRSGDGGGDDAFTVSNTYILMKYEVQREPLFFCKRTGVSVDFILQQYRTATLIVTACDVLFDDIVVSVCCQLVRWNTVIGAKWCVF